MNTEQFCYWLQGLFEVGNIKTLDETQVQIIKDHLNLVFKKTTPYLKEEKIDLKELQRELEKSYPIKKEISTSKPEVECSLAKKF